MLTSIIAASRLRAKKGVNTFIGGLADLAPTANDMANILGINVNLIKNYQTNNNDVAFLIEQDYTIQNNAFSGILNPQAQAAITYYVDLEGYATVGQSCFGQFQSSNPVKVLFYLPKTLAISSSSNHFSSTENAIIAIKGSVPIGFSPLNNNVFASSENLELYTNLVNETNNNGNPDEDIPDVISGGGTVTYVTSTTSPNAVTDLSATTIGGTYVELGFTQPTHVNTLKYALVFVDGFFQDVYDINNVFAVNLEELTSYNIKIIIADEYFNISGYSNTINVTTTAKPALFQNAVAYYKLDETSGQAIDVVNGFNGTLVGGVTQGVQGKIGNAYSFDGNGYIDCGAIDYDEIQISCWFKTSDNSGNRIFLFGQGSQAPGEVLRFSLLNGVIDSAVFGGIVEFGSNAFNDGQWHLLSVSLPSKTSNTSQFELRVDNVLQPITSDPNINMNIDTTQPFIIGALNITTSGFKGQIDEFLINNQRFTIAENSDLYNNGNGITY